MSQDQAHLKLQQESIEPEKVAEPELGKHCPPAAVENITVLKDADLDFPDGGLRAWLVVFGAFCSAFTTFGFINTWGAFQAYYQENTLKHLPASKIALIGSSQDFLTCAISVFVGRLFDIGFFRVPLLLSSCVVVIATILIGECTEFWQIFLCQAVALGLASGTIFGSSLAVVSHWFKKRRSTALGLTVSGMSLGGAVLPIFVRELTTRIGFRWTMRVLGLVFLGTTACVNLFMKRRLPPVKTAGGVFNLKAFKYVPFSVYILATCTGLFGILNVLIYIDVSASAASISPNLSVYFLVIANFVGATGRISMGILADKFGCLTVMIPATFVAGLTTYAWPFAKDVPSLIVVAIVYGFTSATFLGLVAIPLIHMGETADVGRRAGMLYSLNGVTLLAGSPIAGAIVSRTGGYEGAGIYAGTLIMVSVVLLWATRYLMTGHVFRGKF